MTRGFAVAALLLLGMGGLAATLTVGPGQDHDFARLQTAIRAARPEDTILIAPGTYPDIRGILIPFPLTLKAAGAVILMGPEDLPEDHVLFQVATAGPVSFQGLRFRHAGTAIRLAEPGEVALVGCSFEGCERGILVERGKASIQGSTFQDCGVAVEVLRGGVAAIEGSEFSGNGIGVAGEHPCHVSGGENRFSDNGLDLLGDVGPGLRTPLREASEGTVRYPGGGHSSLQEAIDALRPGGRLLLTAPVRESAVVGKDLRIEPAAAGRLACQGGDWGEVDTPFLAVVGEAEVWLSRLNVHGLACGPAVALHLSDVQVVPDRLVLTGNARVSWEGGYGGLKLRRDARAEVKGVHLVLGVELHDRAKASLRDCDPVAAPAGEAILLDGLAELVGSGLVVRGGIAVEDWARLSLSHSLVIGPPSGREWGLRAVAKLGAFVRVELREVSIQGGELGVALSPSGKPRLVLDGVSIESAHIGLAICIRCPELDELYGLWLPPLSLHIAVGPGGISFEDCGTAVCPTCSLEPWPPDFCLAAGLVAREIPADEKALVEELRERLAQVRSLRARYRTRLFSEQGIQPSYRKRASLRTARQVQARDRGRGERNGEGDHRLRRGNAVEIHSSPEEGGEDGSRPYPGGVPGAVAASLSQRGEAPVGQGLGEHLSSQHRLPGDGSPGWGDRIRVRGPAGPGAYRWDH
jgi:hypothetical protein